MQKRFVALEATEDFKQDCLAVFGRLCRKLLGTTYKLDGPGYVTMREHMVEIGEPKKEQQNKVINMLFQPPGIITPSNQDTLPLAFLLVLKQYVFKSITFNKERHFYKLLQKLEDPEGGSVDIDGGLMEPSNVAEKNILSRLMVWLIAMSNEGDKPIPIFGKLNSSQQTEEALKFAQAHFTSIIEEVKGTMGRNVSPLSNIQSVREFVPMAFKILLTGRIQLSTSSTWNDVSTERVFPDNDWSSGPGLIDEWLTPTDDEDNLNGALIDGGPSCIFQKGWKTGKKKELGENQWQFNNSSGREWYTEKVMKDKVLRGNTSRLNQTVNECFAVAKQLLAPPFDPGNSNVPNENMLIYLISEKSGVADRKMFDARYALDPVKTVIKDFYFSIIQICIIDSFFPVEMKDIWSPLAMDNYKRALNVLKDHSRIGIHMAQANTLMANTVPTSRPEYKKRQEQEQEQEQERQQQRHGGEVGEGAGGAGAGAEAAAAGAGAGAAAAGAAGAAEAGAAGAGAAEAGAAGAGAAEAGAGAAEAAGYVCS